MANYYNDNPNLQFYLDHPLMKRIVELKERNFADKETYDPSTTKTRWRTTAAF